MRSSQLVFLCALFASVTADECDEASGCAGDKDSSALLQNAVTVKGKLRPDNCMRGIRGRLIGNQRIIGQRFICANLEHATECEQAAIMASGYCASEESAASTAGAKLVEAESEEVGIERVQHAHKEDDVCVDPSVDHPEDWLCPCYENMQAQCTDPDTYDECANNMMCQDSRVSQTWKDSECAAGSPAGCTYPASLEETASALNNSMPDGSAISLADQDGHESKSMEAYMDESLDNSLAGKRSC